MTNCRPAATALRCTPGLTWCGSRPRHPAAARRRRPRHGGDPLHVRQHRRPKGVVLSHRNLIVGAESVSTYLQQHRRRRHPRGAAAELRRRVQPADDRLRRRRPRGADELPAARGRGASCAPGTGHRPDLRPAAVDPARRPDVAGRGGGQRCATSPTPAGGCRRPTLDRLRDDLPAGGART